MEFEDLSELNHKSLLNLKITNKTLKHLMLNAAYFKYALFSIPPKIKPYSEQHKKWLSTKPSKKTHKTLGDKAMAAETTPAEEPKEISI